MIKLTRENIVQLKNKAQKQLAGIETLDELENWRIHFLGRKGQFSRILRSLKKIPLAERKIIGQLANQKHHKIHQLYQEQLNKLTIQTKQVSNTGHETRHSAYKKSPGHLHPLTLTHRRLQKIFSDLGFIIAEGPLVEEPIYNFDYLNIPLEHPARAETDTFYLENGNILRTHTSPVQLRAVLENNLRPPFKVFSLGRTFREEKLDVTHEHSFHQVEAFMVDAEVSIAGLKGVIEYLFTAFFGRNITTRFRPSYFPFVEPGFEVDMSCIFCRQKGCSICKNTGWIEMLGAGMVHPSVLRNMNVDPAKFSGFAFGGGTERLAMLRYNINDIRLFHSGDLRFLRQFS